MSISHCQYCGAPADVHVHVQPAAGRGAVVFERTGFYEYSVRSCFEHAGRAVLREPYTHCEQTGKPIAACACFWCTDKRREVTK